MKLKLLPLVRTQGGHRDRGDRTRQDTEQEEEEEKEGGALWPAATGRPLYVQKEESAIEQGLPVSAVSVSTIACQGKLSAEAFSLF